jgi:hypothetical protein
VAVLFCAKSGMVLLIVILKLQLKFQAPIFHLLSLSSGGSGFPITSVTASIVGYSPQERDA